MSDVKKHAFENPHYIFATSSGFFCQNSHHSANKNPYVWGQLFVMAMNALFSE